MLKRLNKILTSFYGAIGMAMFSFFSILNYMNESPGWAWIMGVATVIWLNIARLALKNKGTDEINVKLTDDQEQRIKKATEDFHSTMKEVELELTRAAREKACVQSTQEEDTEEKT